MRLIVLGALMLVLFCTLSPAPLLAQEMSEGEVLPPKTEAESPMSPLPGLASTSVPSTTPVPGVAPAEELTPFSTGVIVLGLLVGGLLLLLFEVTIIPGFGVTGITGIVLILAGLALAFMKLDTKLAVIYTLVAVAGLIALLFWGVYVFPHTAMGKRFVLQAKISVEDGYTTGRDFSRYIGMEGVATSDLRPSGIIRVGDDRLDVLSDGEFIPRGSKVKVLREKNGSLIVGPADPPTS